MQRLIEVEEARALMNVAKGLVCVAMAHREKPRASGC
jgi:hypothetical protein